MFITTNEFADLVYKTAPATIEPFGYISHEIRDY